MLSLIAIIALALLPIAVYGNNYANNCSHVNLTNDYPNQLNPGDRVRILTTVLLNCNSGPSSYEGYVSVVDSHGLRLNAVRFFVNPVIFNEDVTTQVTNTVVAPLINMTWQLQTRVDLYLPTAGDILSDPVYSNSSGLMLIQVGTGSAIVSTNTTTSSQTSTVSSTTQSMVTSTLTMIVSTTVSTTTSLTSQVQTVSSNITTSTMPRQQFYADIRLWFVAIFLIAVAIILRLRAMTH